LKAWLLARRSLVHAKARTLVLVVAVALAALLPLAVEGLLGSVSGSLTRRADTTPLLLGAPGSRFDLVLHALYFRGQVDAPLTMQVVGDVRESGLAAPIPLHGRATARGWPLVGTTPDYFRFRGLRASSGDLPFLLGECCVGAEVAVRLGLTVGDRLLSDRRSVYAIDEGYPLRMPVVGVLEPSGGPDDLAVFVSLPTAWVVDGIGHGHAPAAEQPEENVLATGGSKGTVLDRGVVEYQEVTDENRDEFHFHGDPASLPVTAILAIPHDARSRTLLRGRYRVDQDARILAPREVVDEILGFVLRLKGFFDANVVLVGAAMLLLLGLIVALQIQARAREVETLRKLGASRAAIAGVFATELGATVALGLALALGLAMIGMVLVHELVPWL
jgi:putative ABC transport system permease protein